MFQFSHNFYSSKLLMQRLIPILFLIMHTAVYSQTPTQIIRGTVIDGDSRKALAGATVVVEEQSISATTDSAGKFVLKNVPTSRIKIRCTYVGYQEFVTDNIIVNAAKAPQVEIEMTEE